MEEDYKYVIWFCVVFILFLLLFFIYIGFKGDENYFTYKGKTEDYKFEIMRIENITFYKIYAYANNMEYIIPMRYRPEDVENISFNLEKSNIIKPNVYITQDVGLVNQTDSKSVLALMEFNRILGTANYGIYKLNVASSVIEATNKSIDLGLPVITCENVTGRDTVVLLRLGHQNRVDTENGCVILEAENGDDLIRVADRLSYFLLDVF